MTCSPRTDTQTDRQTDRQTHRVTTVGTLSGFQDFFLQPIIKDRPNKSKSKSYMNITGTFAGLQLAHFTTNYEYIFNIEEKKKDLKECSHAYYC